MQPRLEKTLLAIITSLLLFCPGWPALADLGRDDDTTSRTRASAAAESDEVASVNGSVVSRAEFDNALAYQQEIAAIRGVSIPDDQLPALKYQVLENLINQELLYQESQRYGVAIDEGDVNDNYEAQKQKAKFETDAEFEEALKESNKTLASYREELRRGLAIDRFIQMKFTDQTVIPESEAKQYYENNPAYFQQPEQVRVSHILVRVNPDADQSEKDAAREKIEKVMERLKAGEDFASVAGEASEDANSSADGGDLGYIAKDQVSQPFEAAAFALQQDEISDVVETGSGYHVLKLTDRKSAGLVSFEEVKDDISNSLKSSRVNSSVDNYIKWLKIRSTITTYPIK